MVERKLGEVNSCDLFLLVEHKMKHISWYKIFLFMLEEEVLFQEY